MELPLWRSSRKGFGKKDHLACPLPWRWLWDSLSPSGSWQERWAVAVGQGTRGTPCSGRSSAGRWCAGRILPLQPGLKSSVETVCGFTGCKSCERWNAKAPLKSVLVTRMRWSWTVRLPSSPGVSALWGSDALGVQEKNGNFNECFCFHVYNALMLSKYSPSNNLGACFLRKPCVPSGAAEHICIVLF